MNQYTGLVYAVVKGKLAESYYLSSDIEDCVADVFSKFYLSPDEYDHTRSSIKAYLCVIARNLSIDVAKKRSKQRMDISLDDCDSPVQISDELIIDSKFEEDDLIHEVISAIKDLGHPDSEIIIRKYYYGQTSKTIACKTGLSVSNVDTRAHRALKKLRKMFGGN